MLTTHLNVILLIAATVVSAITLVCWNEIGRWGHIVGVAIAIVWFLSVNYDRL